MKIASTDFAKSSGLLGQRNYVPVVLSSDEERNECFRLRHDSYVASENIDAQPDGIFTDQYDSRNGCALLGVRDQDKVLVGSVRLGIQAFGSPSTAPDFDVFKDRIFPLFAGESTIASGARLCIMPGYRHIREVLLSLLLIHATSAHHFGARWSIASGRGKFIGLYERLLGMKSFPEQRRMPELKSHWQLCVADLTVEFPSRRANWNRFCVQNFDRYETEFLFELSKELSCTQNKNNKRPTLPVNH